MSGFGIRWKHNRTTQLDMETVSTEHAMTALRRGVPFIRSGGDGEIYDANEAFEELTGYSAYELKKKGWKVISVQNEDLDADTAITAELVTGKRQSMTVIKSYVSKLGVPIPGQLLAVRFPQGVAPMECALCFFIPLANGSKAALSLVVDYIEKHTNASHSLAEKIATMSNDLQLKKAQTVGERLWDTFGEWALQNPKTALVVLLVLLALNPFPIVVTYVTRMGWLPAQPVQIELQDKHGAARPATNEDLKNLGVIDGQEVSNPVRVVAVASEFSATTESGFSVSITKYGGGRLGPLSTIHRRGRFDADSDRSSPVGDGGISSSLGGPDGRIGSLSHRASGINF